MNCKPGDLAVMVSCAIQEAVGLIVEVEEACPDEGHGPMWRCKALSGAKSDYGYCMPGDTCRIPDAWLRPIRDPGEDARDQTLDWLPVPQLDPVAELGLAVQRLEAVNRRLKAML